MKKYTKKEIDKFIEVLDFSKIEGGLLETGYGHFYSRSRNTLWKKGETSGHVQEIERIITDCDADTLLLKITQKGAACHKGYVSCFYSELEGNKFKIIGKKVFNPEEVYK